MCLIIAFIAIVYAISAFYAGNTVLGLLAVVVALFFITLLIKNIVDVKKIRNEKRKEES
jgi:hypothetical protein